MTIRKQKQLRMTALCSYICALDVDFFAIQAPPLKVPEDKPTCSRYFAKCGYNFYVPLNPEGRGGVAVAWKSSRWELQNMQLLSPKALRATFQWGPLDIALAVVPFHHKHTKRHNR